VKTPVKIAIVLALAGLVAAAVVLKKQDPPPVPALVAVSNKSLPKLLDLGATKCIPCKKMAPILEELKKEYAGTFDVEFIDVWQNPEAGKQYDVEMIPTQIFFDATGKELFRHVGFYGREDILAHWKELGVKL